MVNLWSTNDEYAAANPDKVLDDTTVATIWSCSKNWNGVAVAMLVDRGLLDYDAPISQYWPEFGQNGKEKITVGELMAHRAGLMTVSEPLTLEQMLDKMYMSEFLASQKPKWEAGAGRMGYHAWTRAFYIEEVSLYLVFQSPTHCTDCSASGSTRSSCQCVHPG